MSRKPYDKLKAQWHLVVEYEAPAMPLPGCGVPWEPEVPLSELGAPDADDGLGPKAVLSQASCWVVNGGAGVSSGSSTSVGHRGWLHGDGPVPSVSHAELHGHLGRSARPLLHLV